jgi:enoyl-CoA hydratase/carnithine racemase
MIVVNATDIDPERLVASRECVVVIASGQTRRNASASLLLADYAVMAPTATLHVDSARAWAGVIWRLGRDALRLLARGKTVFDADAALELSLIDEIAAEAQELFAGRSGLALDAAAMLISRRGGDALERAEFARLFAIGEPQRGLAAFLGKRRPRFGEDR